MFLFTTFSATKQRSLYPKQNKNKKNKKQKTKNKKKKEQNLYQKRRRSLTHNLVQIPEA